MAKADFISKRQPYKSLIKESEALVKLLTKKLDVIRMKFKADERDQELVISYQHELKEEYLKLANYNLIINRLSEQHLNMKSDSSIEKVRKSLSLVLGIWEKELGESVHEAGSREYLSMYKELGDNLYMIKHFKLLIFAIDKLLYLSGTTVKWYWTAVNSKVRILISFCNSLDIKQMLKEYSPDSTNYSKYRELYKLLSDLADECLDLLWQKHHSVAKEKRTMTDIQDGLNLLAFFIHFDKLLGESDNDEKYKKKKKAWENYRESLMKK